MLPPFPDPNYKPEAVLVGDRLFIRRGLLEEGRAFYTEAHGAVRMVTPGTGGHS